MAFTVPTSEPELLIAGDLWTWTKELSEYSAADGWTLSYALRVAGQAPKTITATGSGITHTVSVSAATTATYPSGEVQWQSYVTNSGTNARHTIATGRFTVRPNLASTAVYDPRSQIKRTLDAINATLEGTADREETALVIDGMSLQLRSVPDLLLLRDKFAALYRQELNAERIANGLPSRNKIVCRMTRPA
jgi:hypothetical protein